MNNGKPNNNNKTNNYNVRPFYDYKRDDIMEENVRIEDLYDAYYECRRRKRNTSSALEFELHYESKLRELCDELNEWRYEIGRSICFCVTRPKIREIFAASFRDRIVHHLLVMRIGKIIDEELIDDCFSCRKKRGTDYGIKRIAGKIHRISNGYKTPCYVLKCDIRGFFMSIDKSILFDMLRRLIEEKYTLPDKQFVLWLTEKIVMHRPETNCEVRGNPRLFDLLSDDKSLFRSNGKGIPIGNLTSQIFGNFYLHEFDKMMYERLNGGYGRYVDDLIFIHPQKEFLLETLDFVRTYLKERLGLTLHPHKIYLQEVSKGIKFVGQVIKPGRIYVGNRTVNNAFEAMQKYADDIEKFIMIVNCYSGYMRKPKSAYHIRHKFLETAWRRSDGKAYADRTWKKLVVKKRYARKTDRIRRITDERNSNSSALLAIRKRRNFNRRMAQNNNRKHGQDNTTQRLIHGD